METAVILTQPERTSMPVCAPQRAAKANRAHEQRSGQQACDHETEFLNHHALHI
jgi:hypothetical protein